MEDGAILLIVLGVMVVGAVALVFHAAARRRTEALQHLAQELGLDFDPEAAGMPAPEFTHLHLFQQGRRRRARNLFYCRQRGQDAYVFDYYYTVHRGNHSTTYRQTVAALPVREKTLPDFELRPEHIFHKIGSAFGYQDIDFEEDPAFSDRLLLRGPDPDAVRHLFKPQCREMLSRSGDICVEGSGGWLIVYRGHKRIEPRELTEFLELARAVRETFVD